MKAHQIAGTFVLALFIGMGMGFDKLGAFIDIPSFQIVIVGTVCLLLMSFDLKLLGSAPGVLLNIIKPAPELGYTPYVRLMEAGSRFAIGTGAVGTFIGIILMLGNVSDIDSIGPNMAVALITTFYGVMISELCFQPLKLHIISLAEEESSYIEEKDKKRTIVSLGVIGITLILPAIILIFFSIGVLALSIEDENTQWTNYNAKSVKIERYTVFNQNTLLANDSNIVYDVSELNGVLKHSDISSNNIKTIVNITPLSKINNSESNYSIGIVLTSGDGEDLYFAKDITYPLTLNEPETVHLEEDGYSVKLNLTVQ